ncbi:immunity 26/phosphotriesterase HocA family protein [Lihuaxuella thermophila]|uniref:Immunity protein 26 n=1 Tax=Lihuaxuella thermophila TaxID=1173111 RepID=A0A1H8IBB9_9BACL|nr:immunity 26/phosphotriesterase HocA family protein [Lihuaxuella thermophila]SEN66050.1 Immunity protein 26 [Lihuaxuella thermophila]
MGFWEEERQGEKILIGDEPLDILTDAFQQIANHYQTDVGRKPTILELEKLIELALEGQEGYQADMGGFLISECKLKKKKKSKRIQWKPGDVFAIPLNEGEVYGYGMVVKGKSQTDDLYIEYYRLFTENVLSITEIKRKEKPYLFTANTGFTYILSGLWKKIGTLPFNEGEYQLPDFYGVDETPFSNKKVYYIVKGSSDDPDARVYGVSKAEAEAVKNPAGIIGTGIIAEWLYEEYIKTKKD